MLGFFRSKAAKRRPSVPPGTRVYAIGDIHGRRDLLDRLIESIVADDAAREPARTQIIFLGDLVDRGPDSKGVMQRVIDLTRELSHVTVLQGNHEEVFLLALDGDREAMRFFTRIGGRETILSYGVSETDYRTADFDELLALFSARVPEEHVTFLRGLDQTVAVGDYLFVHAGIRPGVAIDEQSSADLRWIRGEFLDHSGDHGCVVVHGHTPADDVEMLHNRIGIDTGAWETGRLTALALEGDQRWIIDTTDAGGVAVAA